MSDDSLKTTNEEQINKVIESLERVPQETKELVLKMALSMTELEIIQSFNQQTHDLFALLTVITKKLNKEKEYNVTGYKILFDNALKFNTKLPLDKFTLIILEFAAEIYEENENCFLEMSIPDAKVTVGNEFGLIRSEMFKKLWVGSDRNDKNSLKDNIILLTTYAHAHLYKTILNKKK
jgi:hypothetical protein